MLRLRDEFGGIRIGNSATQTQESNWVRNSRCHIRCVFGRMHGTDAHGYANPSTDSDTRSDTNAQPDADAHTRSDADADARTRRQ